MTLVRITKGGKGRNMEEGELRSKQTTTLTAAQFSHFHSHPQPAESFPNIPSSQSPIEFNHLNLIFTWSTTAQGPLAERHGDNPSREVWIPLNFQRWRKSIFSAALISTSQPTENDRMTNPYLPWRLWEWRLTQDLLCVQTHSARNWISGNERDLIVNTDTYTLGSQELPFQNSGEEQSF